MVAQGWLVYNLTGSPFYLGLVALARAVPVFLFALVGGACADCYDRRAIVAFANGVVSLLACALGVLTWTGAIAVWHVVAIAFLMGTAISFEMPSRQAMTSDLVGPKHVVNAVGLNSVAFNTAAVLGPAAAAVLIEHVGEASVFLLNAVSYFAVVVAAILMRPTRRTPRGSGGLLTQVVDGLRYVARSPELLALVGLMGLASLLARPYIQLLPVFAADVLNVGASGLGALTSAAGVGAVVAATLVAVLGSHRRRGLVITVAAALFGLALIVFGFSTSFAVSLAASAALGFLSAFTGIGTNTILQTHSDSRLRGRVMSLHGLTMMGVVPLGVMLEGALGSVIGVPPMVIVGGAVTLAAAAWVALSGPRLRALE